MRCEYCYGRLNTAMQCESCGKYSNFPVSTTSPYETTVLPQNTIPPATDLLALLKQCKPWLELDLERRKFTDYDDSENKVYGDKAIADIEALLSDIAKAEDAK